MALEDLTGTGKFVTALNAAWPVDDDWVDEGDNHIRGIKNVMKNTFPGWNGSQAFFPGGTLSAPGISWVADQDSGLRQVAGTGGASYVVNGVPVWGMTATEVTTGSGVNLVVASGVAPVLASTAGMSVVLSPTGAGIAPGIGFVFPTVSTWQLTARAGGGIWFGSASATGPTALNGYSMGIAQSGDVFARSFIVNATLLAAGTGSQVTGALAGLLKLRGVRYLNAETGRDDMGLSVEDVKGVFPELVSEIATGEAPAQGIDYARLAAPLIEAVRELAARVEALEAKLAGH